MRSVHVEVWSDVACPWCYIGKRRLEAAMAALPDRGAVRVVWRAFELDPAAPRVQPSPGSYAERLARKYGMRVAEAEGRIEHMRTVAAADGLDLRFDRIRPGNTFDAHRLIRLGLERGRQDAVQERLFHAYFSEGEPIGDLEVLARLGADAGLDPVEVRALLDADRLARDVRTDEDEARTLGIHGVPFFVLDRRYGVSGAQPADVLRQALVEASEHATTAPAAPACGPDGCA